MDGRRTWALGLCLLTGSLGCTILPQSAPSDQATVAAHKNKEEPRRQPQAVTCVAFGNFAAEASTDPHCQANKRQELRERARKAYQQALSIDPNNLAALTALGWLYVAMDDHDHAVATLQKAVQSHPESATAWFELGRCQSRYHEWTPALDNLHRAVDLDPENHAYTHFYGFSLAHAGKFDESFMVFAKIEGEANAHFKVAQMQHQMKLDEQSKAHLQKALELDPRLKQADELLASFNEPANAGTPEANGIPNAGAPEANGVPNAGTPEVNEIPKVGAPEGNGVPKAATPEANGIPNAGAPEASGIPKAATPEANVQPIPAPPPK
jgi:tetratricopeptide (TPR) repeat protein